MYRNYIDTQFGRLWYKIYLGNWCVMGQTAEQNREAGPCVEILLDDYSVVAHGSDITEALQRLEKSLEFYAAGGRDLPLPIKRPWYKEKWKRFRLNRLFRRMDRGGVTNPVRRT